ncbi:MAG: hypothetical protein ACI9XB_004982, partial [Gammaproteobacteria bacterium]
LSYKAKRPPLAEAIKSTQITIFSLLIISK